MESAICVTCGTQYPASEAPPERCPICEDDRQYVNPDGQQWTTLGAIDRNLAEIDRKRANLTRKLALFDDDDEAAPLVAEIAALGKQRKQLDEERAHVLARREGWQAAQERLDGLEEWYRTVAANLPRGTYEQKREALDIFGFRVKL